MVSKVQNTNSDHNNVATIIMRLTAILTFLLLASQLQAQYSELEAIERDWETLLSEEDPEQRQELLHDFEGNISGVAYLKMELDLSSLKYFTDLRSTDSSLRVVSYFIPLDNGNFILRGHITKAFPPQESGIEFSTISALGRSAISQYSADSVYSFGMGEVPRAWYYDLIETKDKFGGMQYTLLGWTPINRLIHRKVIEPLNFKIVNGVPKIEYGKPIFISDDKRPRHRLIYDYSAQTTMKLSYDESQDWIIMDHLSPSEPKFEGVYEYYGPDFSFDAIRWESNHWQYYPDVNVEEGIKKNKRDFKKADKILDQEQMYESN